MKSRNFLWLPDPRPVVTDTILELLEQGPWYEVHLEKAVHERARCSHLEFANALEELESYQEKIVYRYEEQKFYLREDAPAKEKDNV